MNTIVALKNETMTLLRPTIAGRLLRAGVPSSFRALPIIKRHETTTAAGTNLTTSSPGQKSQATDIPEQGRGKIDLAKHNQPDYTAEVDQASSYDAPKALRELEGYMHEG